MSFLPISVVKKSGVPALCGTV